MERGGAKEKQGRNKGKGKGKGETVLKIRGCRRGILVKLSYLCIFEYAYDDFTIYNRFGGCVARDGGCRIYCLGLGHSSVDVG